MERDIIRTDVLIASYGSAFYKTLSIDLQNLMPDVKSFSVTNLKYMKSFYSLYSKSRQQLVDDCVDEIVFQIRIYVYAGIVGQAETLQQKRLEYITTHSDD